MRVSGDCGRRGPHRSLSPRQDLDRSTRDLAQSIEADDGLVERHGVGEVLRVS
jgi:hypothetical protein